MSGAFNTFTMGLVGAGCGQVSGTGRMVSGGTDGSAGDCLRRLDTRGGVFLLLHRSTNADVDSALPGSRLPRGGDRRRLLGAAVGNIVGDAVARPSGTGDSPAPGDDRGRRRARAARSALEGLGPFYVKMGQMLSTRPDMVSEIMIDELEKLHDSVTTTPFSDFAGTLDHELPGWRGLFRSIDTDKALGSASLAQVYRVTMHDGTPAVVKIQRPLIKSVVLRDMKQMRRVARVVRRLTPRFNELIDVDAMLEVIFNGMRPELDFTLEAQNMVDARKVVKEFKHLTVPKVIEATPKVLVQTFASGTSIGDADPREFSGKQRKKIGKDLLGFMYRGYFTENVFHADPHPGNIFVHPGAKATVIDWGMVGRIDRSLGMTLVLILLGIAQNDAPATARSWTGMGHATSRANLNGFAGDLSMLIPKIHSASLEDLDFGVTLSKILMYATRRGVHTSPHVSLLAKSFANVEGSVRNLTPELSMVDVFEDAMVEIIGDLVSDFVSKKQAARFVMDLMLGSSIALDHVRTILHDVNNRDITLRVDLSEESKQKSKSTKLGQFTLGVAVALALSRRKPRCL
ncbi:ABC1 kinase family protein [Actinokineospora sp. G85]|uniref:ABC1 kinase family protein n=1 Tax=Actinokineospora sp. G85 TaxID=3406626 RepID=UPI003C72361F